MEPRTACITGAGAVSPLGVGLEPSWRALLEGRFALELAGDLLPAPLAGFPVGRVPFERALAGSDVDPRLARRMDPTTVLTLVAAREAVDRAGLTTPLAGARVGVVLGVGFGPTRAELAMGDALRAGRGERMGPFAITAAMPNSAACNLAIAHGARGPAWTISTACAAGLDALGLGLLLIQAGRCDVVLAGGSEMLADGIGVGGMASARALAPAPDGDPRQARPFDRRRAGTVIGEGAAVFVLEAPAFAARRGAEVLGELAGHASAGDAWHLTRPRPDGSGAAEVMRGALAAAGVAPAEVDAVFAHGTGTPLNDAMEARALRAVFGAEVPPFTSTKGQHGHAMGASGPLALGFALCALRDGRVPATLGCREPDPELALAPVRERPLERALGTVAINAFGFGGHDAALVLRRA